MDQKDVKDETAETNAPPTEGTSESTAASPETEIEQLRQKLAEKEEEARGNYDLFLRERAEL
jgi:hypothetical protein